MSSVIYSSVTFVEMVAVNGCYGDGRSGKLQNYVAMVIGVSSRFAAFVS